ncbi:cell wall-active antibiotics response protein [bacterium BMS3Abin03]|jgi:predicted membrane protein|nr:cell wall-active antibiotics response protein [bacterium BMS3Abin03]
MQQHQRNTDKRIVLGGILIVIGAFLLLGSMDIFDFSISHIIFSWPFFFTVIGLFILLNTNKKIFGGILTGIGLFFLLPRIFPGIHYHGGIIIPVILISLGVYIILNHRRKEALNSEQEGFFKKDVIDDVSIFGGGAKIISSDNFRGGNVTAIFGGSEINLTGCKLAEGEQILDVLTVFGGTTILVPKDWNVVVNVTSILGGFSDKSIKDPNFIPDQSRTLHIKGLALFGGGEVKNYL